MMREKNRSSVWFDQADRLLTEAQSSFRMGHHAWACILAGQAAEKAMRRALEWELRICFRDLVRIMVDADLQLAGLKVPGDGRRVLEASHGRWHRWEDQVASMEGASRRQIEQGEAQ